MIIRWVLTTISILILAIIASKVVKKEDIPIEDTVSKEDALLNVNENFCISCGLCAKIAPEAFEMENRKAKALNKIIKSQENHKIKLAIDKCPAKAIKYI